MHVEGKAVHRRSAVSGIHWGSLNALPCGRWRRLQSAESESGSELRRRNPSCAGPSLQRRSVWSRPVPHVGGSPPGSLQAAGLRDGGGELRPPGPERETLEMADDRGCRLGYWHHLINKVNFRCMLYILHLYSRLGPCKHQRQASFACGFHSLQTKWISSRGGRSGC